jgi:uncharacterized protein YjiS (DUF1127 family)
MLFTRKCKLVTQQNQAPAENALFEPGVSRRLSLIVDRGDENHLVPGTGITMDQFHEYQLLGRQLQARAMASAFASLFGAIVLPLGKLAGAYGQARARGAAIRQLASLDDRMLADIGIRRESISAAVAGLMQRQPIENPAPARELFKPAGQRAACNDPHARAAA